MSIFALAALSLSTLSLYAEEQDEPVATTTYNITKEISFETKVQVSLNDEEETKGSYLAIKEDEEEPIKGSFLASKEDEEKPTEDERLA